jgi:prevent-host-death family protein
VDRVTTAAVPVREFKAHLSRYLNQVRAGRALEITSHRKVIAKAIPVPEAPNRGPERLLAAGSAH